MNGLENGKIEGKRGRMNRKRKAKLMNVHGHKRSALRVPKPTGVS